MSAVATLLAGELENACLIGLPDLAVQARVGEIAEDLQLEYRKEQPLTARDRIDFTVGSTGIEVKTRGSTNALARQLRRYTQSPAIDDLIVITTRREHRARTPTHDRRHHRQCDRRRRTLMRTYGTLSRTDAGWVVRAERRVITRIKRLFARTRHHEPGVIVLTATPDIAQDLEWICERYPLTMSTDTAAALANEVAAANATQETIHRILEGWKRPVDGPKPARPLRDYQVIAADLAAASGRLLLADDLGLGKTTGAARLFRDPATLPAVVVTLTHLATPGNRADGDPRSQWARELNTVFPDLTVHVAKKGTPAPIDPPADVIVLDCAQARWLGRLACRRRHPHRHLRRMPRTPPRRVEQVRRRIIACISEHLDDGTVWYADLQLRRRTLERAQRHRSWRTQYTRRVLYANGAEANETRATRPSCATWQRCRRGCVTED